MVINIVDIFIYFVHPKQNYPWQLCYILDKLIQRSPWILNFSIVFLFWYHSTRKFSVSLILSLYLSIYLSISYIYIFTHTYIYVCACAHTHTMIPMTQTEYPYLLHEWYISYLKEEMDTTSQVNILSEFSFHLVLMSSLNAWTCLFSFLQSFNRHRYMAP